MESTAIHLHHAILPRLAEVGVVEYDPEHDQVLYRGGSFATELVDWIMARERSDP